MRSGAFLQRGGVDSDQRVCMEEKQPQMRLGRFPGSQETPLGKSLTAAPAEGARKRGWGCRRHRAREEGAGSVQREKERFQRHLEAPSLCTRYLLGCVWLLQRSLLLQGKFSLVACTYLPVC